MSPATPTIEPPASCSLATRASTSSVETIAHHQSSTLVGEGAGDGDAHASGRTGHHAHTSFDRHWTNLLAPLAMSLHVAVGVGPTGGTAHLDRDGHLRTGGSHRVDEAAQVELAGAGRPAVGEAVGVVVGVLGHPRAVVQLDPGDHLARQCGDGGQVSRTSLVMPHVDADAAVRTIGRLDDAPRVGHVDDVGERQELEPDDQAMICGAVAQLPEGGGRVVGIATRRPDDLQVAAAEGIGHAERDLLALDGVVATHTVASQAGDHLDLTQSAAELIEQVDQRAGHRTLALELRVLTHVHPDAVESVLRGQPDAIVDRVMTRQAEVAEHELGHG